MKLLIPYIFKETKIVPEEFLDFCKNNPNQAQFLPSEVKILLKKMAMELGLYAQVVIICRK